jgi:hypothetical protein
MKQIKEIEESRHLIKRDSFNRRRKNSRKLSNKLRERNR